MYRDQFGDIPVQPDPPLEVIIDQVTQTREAERVRLLRYMGSKMSELMRIGAFSAALDFYYEHRSHYRPDLGKSTILFCGLIRALKRLHDSDTRGLSRKCAEKNVIPMQELRQGRVARDRRMRRQGKKRGKLEIFMAEIVELRNDGDSYQAIADFLKKHHRLKVSSEYVRKVLKKCLT